MTLKIEDAIEMINTAFSKVEYPGDWCLRGSNEGEEPYLLEQEFKGKDDWKILDPKFLDQAPDGFGSALSFFSDEAFHFYLPAYMIADLKNQLQNQDICYHLCYGLDDLSGKEKINPRRYGERTWYDAALYKFSMFNREEVNAIVSFLQVKKEDTDNIFVSEKYRIEQALINYWLKKLNN